MKLWASEQEFNDAFRERIKALRLSRGWSQSRVATMLGIDLERYKKYETRSIMPLYLVTKFTLLVDKSLEYTVTGHEER